MKKTINTHINEFKSKKDARLAFNQFERDNPKVFCNLFDSKYKASEFLKNTNQASNEISVFYTEKDIASDGSYYINLFEILED